MKFDADQTTAITRGLSDHFCIITGGAGTGKTTIIRAIVEGHESQKRKVLLCAFAGKAAARLREATEHKASTIHSMLAFNGVGFKRDTLKGFVVVIDEASMVDSMLMHEIMKRNPDRLILVGDQAQLPPVGRGQPFHDIIAHRPASVSNLTRCYRATEAVFRAASMVRQGECPPLDLESPGERWSMDNTGGAQQTHDRIMELVRADVFDWDKDIILLARNGETADAPATVKGVNAGIVSIISPRREKQKFNVGDRVINTKNNAELDIWNGTTGSVHAIDIDGGVWMETDNEVIDWSNTTNPDKPVLTNMVHLTKAQAKELELAYALTVHKSQGSQYRNVLCAFFGQDLHGILDRSLIYTAVTRTREACCVMGELGAFKAGIAKVGQKRTVLQEMLKGGVA